MLLGGEDLVDDAALGLADALNDDLLGRLRGDAAELLGLHGDADDVAHGGLGLYPRGLVRRHLQGGILHFLHDGLLDGDLDGLLLPVHVHHQGVRGGGIVLFQSREQRLPDAVDHVILRDPLFLFQIRDCFKELGVHGVHFPIHSFIPS